MTLTTLNFIVKMSRVLLVKAELSVVDSQHPWKHHVRMCFACLYCPDFCVLRVQWTSAPCRQQHWDSWLWRHSLSHKIPLGLFFYRDEVFNESHDSRQTDKIIIVMVSGHVFIEDHQLRNVMNSLKMAKVKLYAPKVSRKKRQSHIFLLVSSCVG